MGARRGGGVSDEGEAKLCKKGVNNSILCLYEGRGSQKGMTIIQESVLCYA